MMARRFLPIIAFCSALILPHASVLALPVANPLGFTAPDSAPARTIVIDALTQSVTVKQGETIRFKMGDRHFSWWFDTFSTPAFALSKISPAHFGPSSILVYVTPSDQSLGI